ncbi:hypothetical protein ANOM_005071 [Aspergillus nomiae NRRL 13137]|uniref:Uncharacterized protein n=1 Tax=Aspergillus nomiae NRRL (strain ATCC 15546 / NRRL 13137 / CBS 260.88 / M93) TaxID=1509407 RepID=A0A0L1J3K6_ASPN3|nr:uncharacterized protein ANOM_005071 [Aspergillus nomiae NRRL 13137]KNG85993.1 hypothetical protein ANOM_005071 [Aspergillus nomiae NRRL 13137]
MTGADINAILGTIGIQFTGWASASADPASQNDHSCELTKDEVKDLVRRIDRLAEVLERQNINRGNPLIEGGPTRSGSPAMVTLNLGGPVVVMAPRYHSGTSDKLALLRSVGD